MNQPASPNPTREGVKANCESVLSRMETAAIRSSRSASEITMIAVTKYVDAEVARWLFEFGCTHLAESRPQLLWEKADSLSDLAIDWHLIGHLQRNKAKRTLPFISTMHSLDSERLFEQLKKDAIDRPTPLKLLLEINVSGEPEKTGMVSAEAESLLSSWKETGLDYPAISIVGLMGMGSLDGGRDQARRDFASLRTLRDEWSNRYDLNLSELSMGMSDDFEEAIAEGATMVRIGSILFH